MDYYIYKDDNQTGPFTLGQLKSMRASGLLNADTLYWREGLADWLPLASTNLASEESTDSHEDVSIVATSYYYSTDGSEVKGPTSTEGLQEMYSKGILAESTQVCLEGEEVWRLVSDVLVFKRTPEPARTQPANIVHRKAASPVRTRVENPVQSEPTRASKWTKHADWQPLPRRISEALACCPICNKRGEWEVHDKWGFTTRGYRIICRLCNAEWEYTIAKPQDLLFGGAVAAMYRLGKIVSDDSVWILRNQGRNPSQHPAVKLINKEMRFSAWKQMVKAFCGECGEPLADNEQYCPKCGASRQNGNV